MSKHAQYDDRRRSLPFAVNGPLAGPTFHAYRGQLSHPRTGADHHPAGIVYAPTQGHFHHGVFVPGLRQHIVRNGRLIPVPTQVQVW